ncbi:ce671f73-3a2e-4d86-8a6d-21c11dd39fc4 [Thermothielavioides terrestris]|uniref:Ce671f73-3a2e-4d86-8a6d-21c11dd39fc4 n=1 Tax=Thermothielavioides terrestris TaxID=2587410 RepID=A0A3S4EWB0_9PEZI|nr:ce671f73-3a2e-4d86-8a6d-21c11dd39fc4 [Thermothielavioides terrestris]
MPSGLRTPARGGGGSSSTLETVQEASPIGSPRDADESIEEKLDDSIVSETSQADSVELGPSKNGPSAAPSANDSGSETDNLKGRRRSGAASAPPLTKRQSSTGIKQGVTKTKTGEALQSMTVETETVTSIPQAPLVSGTGAQGSSVSLRTKASTETIRPKKEKKKPTRKQPTVSAGNASSKADIFEAKVASAVEEANSSDSEETFVYDSNPPDARDRPLRFHSRTPSATSMASQADRSGMRSIHAVMESAGPPAVVKKNMKFVNSSNTNGNSEGGLVEDDGRGTGRSNAGSARGTARHHHHFGRWGRSGGGGGGGNGHPSLFAEHSPFSAALTAGSRQSSGPPSPRFGNRSSAGANGKRAAYLSAGYDLDDTTTGADDETTPLIAAGTLRSSRPGRARRGIHSLRSIEAQTYHRPPPSVLNRFASCLVLTVMLLLVVSGAIGFMFATSQPLTDIQLVSMDHVVASQQELMLDLTVRAHNPNVVVVVVDSADIEVFAKSPHAMTDSEWWRHTHPGEIGPPPPKPIGGDGGALSALDADPNPIPDPDPDPSPPDDAAPNMRLGSITGFDSALSFEGSFFHKGISYSTGEVRLKNPGNGTYGGPERWERILEDEFQLILKGVLKYTLPLSQRVRTATISGKATVKPNAANDPPGARPNSTDGTAPPPPSPTVPDGNGDAEEVRISISLPLSA